MSLGLENAFFLPFTYFYLRFPLRKTQKTQKKILTLEIKKQKNLKKIRKCMNTPSPGPKMQKQPPHRAENAERTQKHPLLYLQKQCFCIRFQNAEIRCGLAQTSNSDGQASQVKSSSR